MFTWFRTRRERTPSPPPPTIIVKPRLICSARFVFTLVSFLNLFNVAFSRILISIALVCMSSIPRKELKDTVARSPAHEKDAEFSWTPATLGHITSAAFYGFIIGPFFGGYLSFKYGGKLVMIISSCAQGALCLLTPEATRVTVYLLFVMRVLVGFFSAFGFPAFYDLVAHWVSAEERQFLVTFALVSIPLANILNFPINSVICVYFGWVWIFYMYGIWTCLFVIVIVFTIFDHPEKCNFITEEELFYLEESIPKDVKRKIPWLKIISSMSIYAFVVIHFSVTYVYLNMIFSLPFLLEEIYGVSLKEVGFLSALPFLGSLVMRILLSIFFESIRRKLKLTKNVMRKSCIFIGCFLTSLQYLIIIILPAHGNKYWVLACFVVASTSLELVIIGGYLLSLLDICPSFVNVLTGATNTLGNSAGLISPIVTGLLTPHGHKEEWNYVFYLNIFILNFAMLFYLVFGRNRVEPWGLVIENEDVHLQSKASTESVEINT